jgi:cytochrome c5
MSSDDKVFMKRFSGIIVGLVIVTILIIVIANFSDPGPTEDTNPSRVAMANERTLPVGDVRTELPAQPAASEASPPSETQAAAEPAAADEINGEAIYASSCQACHAAGVLGAPQPGSDALAERAEKGVEALAASAINGINSMPPKGGFTNLSDAEVTAAVEFMLSQ